MLFALVNNTTKLKIMLKKFGEDLTFDYLYAFEDVEVAFEKAMYAEFIVDEFIDIAKRNLK